MDAKDETEMGMLDWLIVVAENLRLLILGPLMVGLLAMGVSFAIPESYVSQATLSIPVSAPPPTLPPPTMMPPTITPAQAALMMVSPQVLNDVIVTLKLSEGRATEVARAELMGQVKATAGKDGVVRLDVTAPSPARAQAIANAVVDRWLRSAVITRQLDGLSRDDVVMLAPTLPVHPVAPKKGMIAMLSILVSGFVLLLWVFMRQAWRNVAKEPLGAQKQARLRAALGLK